MPALAQTTPTYRQGVEILEDFKLEYLPRAGDRTGVPRGHAFEASNIVSYPNGFKTRPGLKEVASFGSAPVSVKEFVAQDAATRRLIVQLADGTLQFESGTYSFSTFASNIVHASIASTLRTNSVTAFGREYMAFSTSGKTPVQVPCAWDGTDFRRVAPQGPGRAPIVATGAAGSVTLGRHNYRVVFRTKWGFLTSPSPAGFAVGTGANALDFTGVPTGPFYVTARIICMTAADDEDLYFVAESSMVIEDNVTTTATVDVTDTVLLAGTPVSVQGVPDSDLQSLIELPPATSVFVYKERLCWLNCQNTLVKNGDIGLVNPSFDGGWNANEPNGWQQKVAGQTPGAGVADAFGDFLEITGDGAGQRGLLENRSTSLAFIPPGVNIRYRVRIRRNSALAAGTFHVVPVTATGAANSSTAEPVVTGTDPTSTTVSQAEVSSTEWRVIDRLFLSAANNIKTENWRLRISGGGITGGTTMTNLGDWYIDYIELYEASLPTQPAVARWSRPGQPDAYDGLTGLQYIARDNGQRLTSGFVLGDVAYFVKESSLHATRDDGAREPAFWTTAVISDTVGSPSPNGVGVGDQWVVIASRDGLYYFDGGQPQLISMPAGSAWSDILPFWAFANTIGCRVDMERKRIYVAVPTTSVDPDTIYCFEWSGTRPGTQPLAFSRMTDPVNFYSMATSQRASTGEVHFLFGISSGNRLVRLADSGVGEFEDYGTAITGQTWSGYLVGGMSGPKRFDKLRLYVTGIGTLRVGFVGPGETFFAQTFDLVLDDFGPRDVSLPEIRFAADRIAVTLELVSAVAGNHMSVSKMALFWHDADDRGTVNRGA